MAGTILSIASQVPWGTLIDRMPEIIDGASKLLQATGVTRKKINADLEIVATGSGQVDAFKLKETVESLESSLLSLNKQVSEAAVLIKELAETKKSLARAGQLHRDWLIRLGMLSCVSLAIAVYALLR